jgi:hypothetical protein
MSMTVKIALDGMTNADYLLEALREMGMDVPSANDIRKSASKLLVTTVKIYGYRVPIRRDAAGNLILVTDSDWKRLQTDSFKQKLKQYYSVAAVKDKVEKMGYHLSEIETLQNGTVKLVARGWR